MVAAKKRASQQDVEDVFVEDEQQEAPTPDDIAIAALLEEFGKLDTSVLRIYREGKGGYRDLTLIDEVSPGDFTPMVLAHPPYNGGSFRLLMTDSKKLVMNRGIRVEPGADAVIPGVTAYPKSPDVAVVQQGNSAEMMVMMKSMMEGFAATIEKVVAARPEPKERDVLGEIKIMAEVLRPVQQPVQTTSGLIQDVIGMIALRDKLVPSEGAVSSDGEGMLGKLATSLMTMMQQRQQQPQTIAQPAAEALPAPQPTEEELDMNLQLMMIQAMLKRALKAASLGVKANDYAEELYDSLPALQIREIVKDAQWLDKLQMLNADVANRREWLAAVRDAIIGFATEDGVIEKPEAENEAPPAV